MGKFGANSSTDEVLNGSDLSGKRVLVTGVSAGLGIETARSLAARGATVVGTARDMAKAEQAALPVRHAAAKGGGNFEVVELDLASLESVRRCVDTLISARKPFDVVIANAGVMLCPFGRTQDGFETQFGTNVLGHFALVNGVAPLLNSGSRFVSLASIAHRGADVDLDDPNFEHKDYVNYVAYARSKTANVLFAVEFNRRHSPRGVIATAVHPGVIMTELMRYMSDEDRARLAKGTEGGGVPVKTIPQGAATSVWAGFVAPAEEIAGKYCEDCHVAEVEDNPATRYGVRSYALNPVRAKALWLKAEELIGRRY